ncbi:tetratricopeptide repeat protein [Actinomadura sp. HBU206391]|uniref:tetratricopeptide repeat protein n=1 Tax=Actinomadura sp. HBU206391 TaxID=2731692 RepID=UPI001C9C1724|nr:tetratricopeptide repeat protein [Actinomadura sp. HBU206391]MBC6460048.1 tetratricopeptide repeat protein [Actinomadura sp. HBU206391]
MRAVMAGVAPAQRLVMAASMQYGKGRIDEAQKLIDQARGLLGDFSAKTPGWAELLRLEGSLHRARGNYTKALELYEKALAAVELLDGRNSANYEVCLRAVADVRYRGGDIAGAKRMVEDALKISRPGGGRPYAFGLQLLARIHQAAGNRTDAEPLLAEAAQILHGEGAAAAPLLAANASQRGLLAMYSGRLDEALAAHRQALSLRRRTLGRRHHLVAESLHNLALVYAYAGRYRRADRLLEAELRVWEAQPGGHRDQVALALNTAVRGQIQALRGHRPAARLLLEQAVAAQRQTLGPGHEKLAATLVNLGVLSARSGRPREALSRLLEAAEIETRLIGAVWA